MAKGQIKVGTYTGTGSAYNLELGFAPDIFITMNYTDGDFMSIWSSDMTDDTGIDISTAVAGNAADAVTPYAGSSGSNSQGLTLGTDLSESAKVYAYIAIANS